MADTHVKKMLTIFNREMLIKSVKDHFAYKIVRLFLNW